MRELLALRPPSAEAALNSWRADPAGLVCALALFVGYLRLVRRASLAGHHWPPYRALVFIVAGIGTLLLATAGPFGVYARELLWVYVVKVLLLLLITPIFLAFGRPLTLARLTRSPDRDRGRAEAWLQRLRHPLVGPALVPICTGVVFFTGLLTASLRSTGMDDAVAVGLLLAGCIFALPLAGEGAPPASLALAFAVFAGFLELLADAIPGFAMRMRNTLIAPWYAHRHPGWGPSALNDQHLGGSILWMVAELVDLPFLALMLFLWIRADAREAAEVDRQLDDLERDRQAVPSAEDDASGEPSGSTQTPWWEKDASVFGARAKQFRR